MKIYLDYVFFINFFFDFILLFGTSKVLKEIVSLKRLILGSFIGSFSLILLFIQFNSFFLIIFKFILSIFIILGTFGCKHFIKNITYFYLLSIILGGSLYLLDISYSYSNMGIIFIDSKRRLSIFIILIISPIVIYLYVCENIKYKNIYSNHYNVEIYLDSNKYIVEGILDTGNRLIDPYKRRSVILVDLDIDISKYKYIYVPYRALNNDGVIPCIKPNRVIINEKIFSNCLIGISHNKFSLDGSGCILPNTFKEELI